MSANGQGTKLEEASAEQPILTSASPRKETQLCKGSIVTTNGASTRPNFCIDQVTSKRYRSMEEVERGLEEESPTVTKSEVITEEVCKEQEVEDSSHQLNEGPGMKRKRHKRRTWRRELDDEVLPIGFV